MENRYEEDARENDFENENKDYKIKKSSNETNGFGVAGFVLAIVSLFLFPFILGILGMVFGFINSESGLGKAAIIIGIISIIWAIIVACTYTPVYY